MPATMHSSLPFPRPLLSLSLFLFLAISLFLCLPPPRSVPICAAFLHAESHLAEKLATGDQN